MIAMVLRAVFWQVGIGLVIGIPAAIGLGISSLASFSELRRGIRYCCRRALTPWNRGPHRRGDPRAKGS